MRQMHPGRLNDPPEAVAPLPLCVDLDGTLCRSDTLVETFAAALRRDALELLKLPLWLFRGRAQLKAALAALADLDASTLPYNKGLLRYLRRERRLGRPIILATAADKRVAASVARELKLFDEVLASDGLINLKGVTKAEELVRRFGEGAFAYIGSDRHDLPIWRRAGSAAVVKDSNRLAALVGTILPIELYFDGRPRPLLGLLKALRLRRWGDNALVFVPLLAAHTVLDLQALTAASLSFLAFGMTASGIYLLNDLVDLESDRRDPRRRKRPFASGDLPLLWGFALGPAMLFAGATIAMMVAPACGVVIILYAALSRIYFTTLKNIPFWDVFALAFLYALQLLAGGAAIGMDLSAWLLSFCGFFFLALALFKRGDFKGIR